jgi:hypothetical protein
METSLTDSLMSFSGFGGVNMQERGIVFLLVVMVISLLSSLFVSLLYVKFYKSRSTGSQIHRAFPLLGVSITAVFICIQFSLPLSLGLLGALSIVRFRTPIKEPEEIGFIMVVVATSLCCATFNMLFLAMVLIVTVAALIALKFSTRLLKGRLNDGMLIVTLSPEQYRNKKVKLLELLEQALPQGRIDSISEGNEEAVVSYSFIRLNREKLMKLQSDLQRLDNGVQSNVFFNNSGQV